MKAIATTAILWFAFFGALNAQWQDDFSDGDFTSNPQWQGNVSDYSVNNGILELDNSAPLPSPQNNYSALYTVSNFSSLNNLEWRFHIDHGFAGSDNNQSRIYLTANGPATSYSSGSAGVIGYYISMGEAGSADVIKFYYDNGSSATLIASGTSSIANSFAANIRITRDAAANWTIQSDFTGGSTYNTEVTFSHSVLNTSSYFGFINKYTSSNSNNIAFDDFYVGPIQVDTTPPSVSSVTATSLTTLDVLFSEPVSSASATDPTNYNVLALGSTLSAALDGVNPALVHLTTPPFLANTDYQLEVQLVADASGNAMTTSDIVGFNYFQAVQAEYGDVVFNEILADPTPTVGLPEAEFVELVNQDTANAFNFQGWKFVNTSTEKILPSFSIAPGEYVILCDVNNVALFQPYGEVLGIPSFTALTNAGDSLTLLDNNNQIIDIVVYSDDWFETTVKRDGGWSLERSGAQNNCGLSSWRESIATIGGTPGSVNSITNLPGDTSSPTVVSLEVTNSETLILTFSEAMDTTGWSIPSWDVLPFNGITNGSWSAELDAVTLTLSIPISSSSIYTLILNGIEDCSGNTLAPTNLSFAIGVAPSPGDIIINEIMADPTPSIGAPVVEYIEVRNNTANLLDLSELKINAGFFNSQVVLAPNAFLIIADSENSTAFDASIPTAFMDGFPSLTNSGLEINLFNGSTLLDRVNYTIDWYRYESKADGGWTLERINPIATCSGRYNWRASNATSGSTPGTENSVYSIAPNGPPTVVDYGATNDSTIYVLFSESMDVLSAQSLSGDLGNGVLAINPTWNSDFDLLTFSTSTPLVAEVNYTLSLSGITDCDGNASAAPVLSFLSGVIPSAGEIIINEIMADGTSDNQTASQSVDFIEIFNRTNRLIDLTQLKVNNGFFTSQVLLQPDSFLIITDSDSDPIQFFAYPNVAFMDGFPALYEDGTTIRLILNNDTLETIRYSKSYYNDSNKEDGGWSMERVNPDDPCNSSDNWRACVRSQGSSAGKTNSVLDRSTDVTAPQLMHVLAEPENAITLVFNEPLQQPGLNVMQWTVDSIAVDATTAYLSGDEYNELVLTYGTMEENTIYTFQLIGIDDCWSNMNMGINGSFALPVKPVQGDLVINEILYDPYEGGSDFIEIYNRSAHAVSLDSCAIADATNGEMNTPDFITKRNLLLMPGSFLALARDGRELPEFYFGTDPNAVWKVEGMSDFSSDDIVYLLLPDGNICDEVPYNSDFHFPLLNTTDGVSLERVDYYRASNDATNWHSAAESAGFATPGIVNSQAVLNADIATEITVDPEIFSPDNDGYNDVVTFSIQLEKAGFVGNLNIYTSEGRPVRYLMQNMLLGEKARISWDGISDDGTKAPIGIYVIVFEAFNTEGQVVAGKTSCVLAHPLD